MDGSYSGKIIAVMDEFVLQEVGMHAATIHRRKDVPQADRLHAGDHAHFFVQERCCNEQGPDEAGAINLSLRGAYVTRIRRLLREENGSEQGRAAHLAGRHSN
ncbi:hypothetical protein ACFS07_36260 [Undibacterium arcticum]